jgi:hypothetical protein
MSGRGDVGERLSGALEELAARLDAISNPEERAAAAFALQGVRTALAQRAARLDWLNQVQHAPEKPAGGAPDACRRAGAGGG